VLRRGLLSYSGSSECSAAGKADLLQTIFLAYPFLSVFRFTSYFFIHAAEKSISRVLRFPLPGFFA